MAKSKLEKLIKLGSTTGEADTLYGFLALPISANNTFLLSAIETRGYAAAIGISGTDNKWIVSNDAWKGVTVTINYAYMDI